MIYRVDLHVHTNASDDGSASLAEMARAARSAGIDAIAITDHQVCTPVPAELHGVVLIPGIEVAAAGCSLLGLFLDQQLDCSRLRRNGGLPTADEVAAEIRRCGGLSILAEPFERPHVDPAQFPLRPCAVESANARAALTVADANKRALLWATARDLPQVGGSDAHFPEEIGNAYTELACQKLTLPCLKEALDMGHCRPVLVRNAKRSFRGQSEYLLSKKSGGLLRLGRGVAGLVWSQTLDMLRPGRDENRRGKKPPRNPSK